MKKKNTSREQERAICRKGKEYERSKVLEEAKKIVLEEDASLPKPGTIKLDESGDRIKLRKTDDARCKGTRVVISGKLAKTHEVLTLTREIFIEIFGEMREVPAGARAPLNCELHADSYRIAKH
ncbi:hypothetical protein QQS21_011785 [Conoideocrella luteorostrata]|uniref:Uncharacterized protein n=1 Tax=Conoideocrella luteorostrata TaxID=1105319 RepID=A0AAJ0FVI3_9HYPO|nr:hypothetical protein QQS21_011785 [Conoideocrella luteorostrata]